MAPRLSILCSLACLAAALPAAAIQIDTPALSIGVPGVAYPSTPYLTASGAVGGVTWSISAGSVPGLSITTVAGVSGSITGTPTTPGFFPITIRVSDSATPTPNVATRDYIVEVRINASYFPPDNWEARGIFGGTLREIRPSPNYATDGTIVAGGVAGELFITANRGGSWTRRPVNPARLDADLHTVRLSPDYDQNGITASSATIFVASRDIGVWKSTDRGLTFAAANSGLPCDGVVACPDGRPNITGLALSPNYPSDNTLFAVMGYAAATVRATLWKSVDGGATWAFVANLLNFANSYPVDSLEISPDFANDGMLMSGPTCQKSFNGGLTWLGCGGSNTANRITFSPDFATDRTVSYDNYFSYDGGVNFTRHPAIDFYWLSAVKRPGLPALWYGVAWPLASNYLGSYSLYRSEDGMRAMTRLFGRGLPPGIKGSADVLASARLQATPLSGGVTSLVFASPQGIHLSFDDGFSFIPRSSGLNALQFSAINGSGTSLAEAGPGGWILNLGDRQWIRKAIGGNFEYALLSPSFTTDNALFVIGRNNNSSAQEHQILRSTDRGQTLAQVSGFYLANQVVTHAFLPGWTPGAGTLLLGQAKVPGGGSSATGLRRCLNGCTQFSDLALVSYIDTAGGGRCTLNGSTDLYSVAVSSNYGSDQTLFVSLAGDNQLGSPANVGICRSVDGGVTWQAVQVAGSNRTGPLALAPGYSQLGANGDGKTLVLSATNGIVYRSTDGGFNWTAATGLPGAGIFGAVGISPAFASDGAVLVASGTAALKRFPGQATGLWISRDKGASFTAAPGALGTRLCSGLYIPSNFNANNAPSGPGMVVATDGSGLWKSNGNLTAINGVSNYKQLGDNQTAVAVGPVSAGSTALAVLAGTSDQGIFRSADGGATFDPYSAGLPAGANVVALWIPSAAPTFPLASLANNGIWRWNNTGNLWVRHASGAVASSGNYTQFYEDGTYLYAARSDGPPIRSADGGATWSTPNAGVGDTVGVDFNNSASLTTPDPFREKTVGPRAVTGSSAPLWGVSLASGPRWSTDNGVNWTGTPGANDYTLPAGQSWKTVKALGLNAQSGAREVLAGSSNGTLILSRDGGDTWRRVDGAGSGLEASSKNFSTLISTPTAFATTDILVGVAGTLTGGVFLSGDGGEHWIQINQGYDPTQLSISTLVKTSCAGCPVQYYSGSFGGGMYTRTFTVVPPPQIPSVNYACWGSTVCACATDAGSGPIQGGQPFKLCGSNFQNGLVVEFDGAAASGCTQGGGTVVTCTGTPAHIAGSASVRVRNPDTRVGALPAQYLFTGGSSRPGNTLRVAKSGADASLTWSCASCSAGAPARIHRAQNTTFSIHPENYNGGAAGSFSNTGAIASAQSYFWSVE